MAAISVQEGGGGDYTTLEAAVENGSTIDGDVITISGTWTARENTRIAVTDALTIIATGDSKQIGRPWDTGDTHFQHRSTSSGHSFTITDTGAFTIEDLDIILDHTGVSDEIFRNNISNTFTARRCILGFGVDGGTDQQDVYYNEAISTALFEQCHFYNVFRAVCDVTAYDSGSTIKFNSCTGLNIGFSTSGSSRSGVIGMTGSSNTITNDIFNCVFEMNVGSVITGNTSGSTNNLYTVVTNATTLIDVGFVDTDTDNTTSATINATDSAGNYILRDITSPWDLRLLDSTNNAAQDHSTNATGLGLTIPSTDIVGTSRPQNTDFDIGAFEVEAGGGVTVAIPVGSIALTGQTPTIAATANITISVPVGSISLTGQTPVVIEGANVDVTVPVGAISLAGLAPTVLTGADIDITVPVGSISLTGLTPVIQATNNISVDVPVGSISLSGFAPTIQTGDFVTVEVPAGVISLSGLVPTIDLTNNISITIPVGSITLSGFAPVVDLGDLTVIVNTGSITLTGFAPSVITVTSEDLFFTVIGRIDSTAESTKGKINTSPVNTAGIIEDELSVIGRISGSGQSVSSEL